MATLGTGALTLTDWAKRKDPSGKTDTIVELLAQTNEALLDMRFLECNNGTTHRTTVRTGLPTVAWRMLNAGATPSKSTTAQIDAGTGMLEAWSEVDVDLAKMAPDLGAFRLSEGMAFVEAMNQEVMQTVIYGNQGLAPEEFTGLAPHYSAISGASNAENILDAGGTGSDNSSIWLAVWGDRAIHGLFPQNSAAGLLHNDYGEVTVEVTAGIAGTRMRALQERWQWKVGLCVRDWRQAVRICNIDISDLVAGTGADLVTLLIKAEHRLFNKQGGRAAIMMNRSCFEYLDIQRRADVLSGGQLSYQDVDGIRRATFRGIPISITDALTETEAQVT